MAFVARAMPALMESFRKAGLVPPETIRIIVDIPLEMPVKIYYECFAPGKLADIDLGGLLAGNAVTVEPVEAHIGEGAVPSAPLPPNESIARGSSPLGVDNA